MGDSELNSAFRGNTPPTTRQTNLWRLTFAPRAKRCESVAALLVRSLRLEPSSFRTACCCPVLVEVEAHEGLFKQGSLLQQVKRNVAAPASTTCVCAYMGNTRG